MALATIDLLEAVPATLAPLARADLKAIVRAAMFLEPERRHVRPGERRSRLRAFSEIGGSSART